MDLFRWFWDSWESYKTDMRKSPIKTCVFTFGLFALILLGYFALSFAGAWGSNLAPRKNETALVSVATSSAITASSSVIAKTINATNVAVGNTAPVIQSSIVNKYPPPRFSYSLATSSYDASTTLYRLVFDLTLVHFPGDASSTLRVHTYFPGVHYLKCDYTAPWVVNSPDVTGLIVDTNQLICETDAQVIDNGHLIKYTPFK